MDKYTINNPSHPGELIKEDILPHYNLTITDAASKLDITRANLSNVLNGKAALTSDLAAKIEKAFGVNAELLLNMMALWSLAKSRSDPDLTRNVERIPEPA